MIPDKYKISSNSEEYITPEETLADSLSKHPSIETPIGRGVFRVFYGAMIVVLSFFFLRSFQLQVLNGATFLRLAERNAGPKYPLPALRGLIYDTNGKLLVENIPIFDLIGVSSELSSISPDKDEKIGQLSDLIKMDIKQLKSLVQANSNLATFLIKKDINKELAVKLKLLFKTGFHIVEDSQRHYISGLALSHVLGYTAKVSQSDIKSDNYYLITDKIGRFGLETEYENFLRGQHGDTVINNDLYTKKQDEYSPGNDLVLNIDLDVQEHLYKSLSSIFDSVGVKRGAAIVQNPKTGQILALVSMPSFDPNVFENYSNPNSAEKISRILSDKNKPLSNKVISGRYSPGSTIKPLLALAGLKEGVVNASTTIFANGSITVKSKYDPNTSYIFKDWRVHGLTDIKKAISDSVDVYFYALGGGYGSISGLGIDRISGYLKAMLADKTLGIDLPGEATGFVPTVEWKKEAKGEDWFIGDTYNISIGQGDLLVTPLWINSYIGSIANGGKLMKPYIVRDIRGVDDKVVKGNQPQLLEDIPFDQKTIDTVREGMKQTVTSGTATLLNNLPIPLAAKTGTAQVDSGKNLNSLFTVFGPYDNPEFTMTVLVENINQSQGLAVRVVNDFLTWYLNRRGI